MSCGLLTDAEAETLVLLTVGRDGSATEEELQRILEWANDVRASESLLDNVLAGNMFVRIKEGDEPRFSLTAKGKHRAKEPAP